MFLAYLQQNGLSQLNGEGLVLFVLFVINNLDFDDLPALKVTEKDDDQMTRNSSLNSRSSP